MQALNITGFEIIAVPLYVIILKDFVFHVTIECVCILNSTLTFGPCIYFSGKKVTTPPPSPQLRRCPYRYDLYNLILVLFRLSIDVRISLLAHLGLADLCYHRYFRVVLILLSFVTLSKFNCSNWPRLFEGWITLSTG